MKDLDQSELMRLLSGLCDEQLGEAEAARLEELLADEGARQVYLEYMDMQARLVTLAEDEVRSGSEVGSLAKDSLRNEAEPRGTAFPGGTLGTRMERHRGRSLQFFSYSAVVAATVAATVLVQFLLRQPPVSREASQPMAVTVVALPRMFVATLTQVSDVQWGAGTQAYRAGSRILAGEFELRQGIARLAYDGGIELIVEGPARLKLESESAAAVVAGKVVFRADDASAPFRLSTPSAVLIDIGTEYAVEVAAEREEIHVFSGEVQRVSKEADLAEPPQLLAAGEARRFGGSAEASGERAAIEPEKFVRQLPAMPVGDTDPTAGLLAREGFDYAEASALREETANGGLGFVGAWGGGFARAPNDRQGNRIALNVAESLRREATSAVSTGGSFDHVGFAKYFRRLATPVRLDADGVYYFSYLLRREGPPLDPLADVSIQLRQTEELENDQRDATIDLRKRLNFGVDRTNELFTHLERVGRRMPLPLSYGETYLLVAKVAASGAYPDQVFLRIYGPQEPVDRQEPATWSAVGAPVQSDLVFDWLEFHINSHTRQVIDEIRIGTNWGAVTAAWIP